MKKEFHGENSIYSLTVQKTNQITICFTSRDKKIGKNKNITFLADSGLLKEHSNYLCGLLEGDTEEKRFEIILPTVQWIDIIIVYFKTGSSYRNRSH
eukprot:UN25732